MFKIIKWLVLAIVILGLAATAVIRGYYAHYHQAPVS